MRALRDVMPLRRHVPERKIRVDDVSWLGQRSPPKSPARHAKWLRWRELGWDSTARKYPPPSLRGLKPITSEPWSDDVIRYDQAYDTIGTGSTTHTLTGGLLEESEAYHEAMLALRRLKMLEHTFSLADLSC